VFLKLFPKTFVHSLALANIVNFGSRSHWVPGYFIMSIVEKNLKHFGKELDDLIKSFYVWKYIHKIAFDDKDIHKALNKNALSWVTILLSLQSTYLITFGRIFDNKNKKNRFSIYILLDKCIENINEFSDTARKEDFENLKKEIENKKKIIQPYLNIRHQKIAHTNDKKIDNTSSLFEKTEIGEIEEIVWRLKFIYDCLWGLFLNGHELPLDKIKDITVEELKGRIQVIIKKRKIRDDVKSLLETIKKSS